MPGSCQHSCSACLGAARGGEACLGAGRGEEAAGVKKRRHAWELPLMLGGCAGQSVWKLTATHAHAHVCVRLCVRVRTCFGLEGG